MPGFLLVNPRSGDAETTPAELCAEAERHGVDAHVLREGEDPAELARAADAPALGMAGGDGSLGPVAAVAIERDLPFVCVPFGTRNHFARDVGLDRDDPLAALRSFEGRERRIDVGWAGKRLFLNNVSVGVYGRLVHRREEHRRRGDALATLRALGIALRQPTLRASVDGRRLDARILLVANNHYALDVFSLGARERLDDGLLHLYVAGGVLPRTWEEQTAPELTLDVEGGEVPAAFDGEPAVLRTPVDFRIAPGALRVLLPPGR